MKDQTLHIAFVGGGTAGPVTPLLAVMDACQRRFTKPRFSWIGTRSGPEQALLAQRQVSFFTLRAAKIDRFLSLRNLAAPFLFVASCVAAWRLLKRLRPDVVVAAGAFVAVPVVIMSRLMRIPTLIHQLDVRPGLANKFMAPFASAITVTFESSLADFAKNKTTWTGAPVRESILRPQTTNAIPTNADKPVVLVFGGGTGAQAINELVVNALDDMLPVTQVIHLTGEGKRGGDSRPGYFPYAFLREEMGEAYAKAGVVVTRAGLGAMLELAALQKPAIVIPIPHSHQLDNARILAKEGAAIELDQKRLSPQELAAAVIKLLKDEPQRKRLAANIKRFYQPDAASRIVDKISDLVYSKAANSTQAQTHE